MNAVITNHFIEGKAFYPNGGTSVISEFFIPIIKAAGGDVFVRANVTKIILKNNTAIGVEIKGNFKVYARLIISAAGVLNTYNKLITVDQNNNFANKARSCLIKNNNSNDDEHLEKSCSMYTTFIGLNIKGKTMDELQIKAKNIWTCPSWDHDLNFQYYDKSCNDPCNFYMPLVFLASSSAKDKSWSTRYPDKIVFEMLTVADYNAFSDLNEKINSKPNHRSDKYKNCKKIVEERMLKVILYL
jgi:all-trans-retinol 13,14-reductase